jgi:hypothetical protein
MMLIQKLLTKFNGLHFPQEYLCTGMGSLEQPLSAYLICHNRIIADITQLHWFVGYHPLVLAIPSSLECDEDGIMIAFSPGLLQPNENFRQKDAIALLRLKKIKESTLGVGIVNLYQGIYGQHQFVSAFHQYLIGLNNQLYNRKKGNVFLHDNLYKQVQIAYALPRNISLITVGQAAGYNLFPTDLHGAPDEHHYIISLRHSGKACRQVENSGKIQITQVHHGFYKTVYSLGKNHMQELKPRDNFPFSNENSQQLHLPVPLSALYYRELELQDSFIYGIHKLMFFNVLHQQGKSNHPDCLAHIHNVYATWRHNKRLPGNYLLR